MASFLTDNFILESDVAEQLYHGFAKHQPIIDYHSHLSPEAIASNKKFENITDIWLKGDHYKWRAMRALGVEERYITGDASDSEKFAKWAQTVPYTVRNPLFHWTHMELKNPFGITELLNANNAESIYNTTTKMLQQDNFSTQGLLQQFNVVMVGTTDDPIDTLEHHLQLKNSTFSTKILPSFRPDKIFNIHTGNDFREYVQKLGNSAGINITDLESLMAAYSIRIAYFDDAGCCASDHGLTAVPPRDNYSKAEIDAVFKAVLNGDDNNALSVKDSFSFYVLAELCKLYYDKGWVQQFHLGSLRNSNAHKVAVLGADTGYDTVGDYKQGETLAYFLNHLESHDKLAKTVLYNLNPADNTLFATMAGNFQGEGIRGKVQFGSGWWFLDQLDGMTKQINTLSNQGLISTFIGMLTDSRSFLSYSRHEYFRRLICNLFAQDIKKGYIPNDINWIGSIIGDICYNNAKNYFRL
ncbi:glucuronate isomerase [Flavobacterium sp. Sd200]|uniref:glucuronate isomerase n=1 Tax=Flavobacterium sp. Sd200 TaxID=2692211 RepID=UPI001371EC27|nr:glucuronate isomerase [Flavobacterium sp. Sd200]MXN93195.1 glucuronate isomerase [Flavobacterium sp. Sd200]